VPRRLSGPRVGRANGVESSAPWTIEVPGWPSDATDDARDDRLLPPVLDPGLLTRVAMRAAIGPRALLHSNLASLARAAPKPTSRPNRNEPTGAERWSWGRGNRGAGPNALELINMVFITMQLTNNDYGHSARMAGSSSVVRLDAAAIRARAEGAKSRAGEDVRRCFALPPPEGASVEDARSLLEYVVPALSADGMCSTDVMAPAPFELHTELGVPLTEDVWENPEALRVFRLKALVDVIAAETKAEWVGIYEKRAPRGKFGQSLFKLAYVGSPSRPEFPLTEAFARASNNSTVAMTSTAVIIPDTDARSSDVAYYVCDGRVKYELCAPLVDAAGEVHGIIDIEAWRPHALGEDLVDWVLAICEVLAESKVGKVTAVE
jgi:L-methionine (R)-S-oxide reductase